MKNHNLTGILGERVTDALHRHRTQVAWAKHLGHPQAYLSKMLKGRVRPSEAMLIDLGLMRIVTETYEPYQQELDI